MRTGTIRDETYVSYQRLALVLFETMPHENVRTSDHEIKYIDFISQFYLFKTTLVEFVSSLGVILAV